MHHELGTCGRFNGVLLSCSSLLSPVCTIVWNKSKLAVTKADRISLQLLPKETFKESLGP